MAISLLFYGAHNAWASEPADQILLSNHVIDMAQKQGTKNHGAKAQAVAVREGKIVWIGDQDQYASQADNDTEIIQLGSKALLPGFIDAHGHASFLGPIYDYRKCCITPGWPCRKIWKTYKRS